MAKTKTKKSVKNSEGIYILKLVLYLILGCQWLRITKGSVTVPLPLGVILGLLLLMFGIIPNEASRPALARRADGGSPS